MSRDRSVDIVKKNKESALQSLDMRIQGLIDNGDPIDLKRADLLSFWIKTYSGYLKQEKTFDPNYLINYRKGDIVKINLGYRIGNEEGGLHFGVVMDVNNSKRSGIITIVPLTSTKPGKVPHKDSVGIGREVFQALISKHDKLLNSINAEIIELQAKIADIDSTSVPKDDLPSYIKQLERLTAKSDELSELRKSIMKMKQGSIALVNQITTISKIRISDPLYTHSVLYGIRLSDTTICAIDDKLCDLYVKNR